MLDDQAAEHQADAAADPEHRADGADRHAHLVRRELVADDPEAEREDRRPGALQRAEARSARRCSAPASRRGSRTPKIPSEITSSFFLPCASPSLPMIGVSTEADQEARHQPRHPRRRRVELLGEERQRRHHQRLHDRERDARDGQQAEREFVGVGGHDDQLAGPRRGPARGFARRRRCGSRTQIGGNPARSRRPRDVAAPSDAMRPTDCA